MDATILPNGNYFAYKSNRIEDNKFHLHVLIYGIYDTDFNLIKEFGRLEHKSKRQENRSRAEFIAGVISRSAFEPPFIQEITPRGKIYTGIPHTYEIKVHSLEGKLQRIISREYKPIPFSQKHKDRYFEDQATSILERLSLGGSFQEEVRKHMEYPKFLPAYKWFTLMENGWLYVVVDAIKGDYALIDLFDEQGTYIGQFSSNIPTIELYFQNNLAYAVVTEDHYKFIKTYAYEIQDY